jgi:hypothetical protein
MLSLAVNKDLNSICTRAMRSTSSRAWKIDHDNLIQRNSLIYSHKAPDVVVVKFMQLRSQQESRRFRSSPLLPGSSCSQLVAMPG